MPQFDKSQFHNASSLNGGNQFATGNAITTQSINYPFENTLYLNDKIDYNHIECLNDISSLNRDIISLQNNVTNITNGTTTVTNSTNSTNSTYATNYASGGNIESGLNSKANASDLSALSDRVSTLEGINNSQQRVINCKWDNFNFVIIFTGLYKAYKFEFAMPSDFNVNYKACVVRNRTLETIVFSAPNYRSGTNTMVLSALLINTEGINKITTDLDIDLVFFY